MANTVKDTIETRKVAILAADGVDTPSVKAMQEALLAAGAQGKIVATHLGALTGADGDELPIDFSLLTASSVLFDAVYVPGGADSVAALSLERDAVEFVTEAYRHCKPIAASGEGIDLLRAAGIAEGQGVSTSKGAATPENVKSFLNAMAQHRFWTRTSKNRLGPPSGDETRGRPATSRRAAAKEKPGRRG